MSRFALSTSDRVSGGQSVDWFAVEQRRQQLHSKKLKVKHRKRKKAETFSDEECSEMSYGSTSNSERGGGKRRRGNNHKSQDKGVAAAKMLKEKCKVIAQSQDQDDLLVAVNYLMRRFETGQPSIAMLYSNGVVDRLIQLMNLINNDELLLRSLVALNNVVARSDEKQFTALIEKGIFDNLLSLLEEEELSRDGDILEQTIWIMDNIALDDNHRDNVVMKGGGLTAVLQVIHSSQPCKAVEVITSKFLRTIVENTQLKYPTDKAHIEGILQALSRMLYTQYTGSDVLPNMCFALAKLVESESKRIITAVFAVPAIPSCLIDLLGTVKSADILYYAVVTLGHLATGTQEHINTLLSLDLLQCMHDLLQCSKQRNIVSGVCGCLSNICTGDTETVSAVVQAKLVPTLVHTAINGGIEEIKNYTSLALYFATHSADLHTTQYQVDQGVVTVICTGLQHTDHEHVVESLEALYQILNRFTFLSDFEHVADIVTSCDGWLAVNYLRHCEHAEVKQCARRLSLDAMRAEFSVDGVKKIPREQREVVSV